MGQTMRVVAIAKALQRRGHEAVFVAGGKLIPVIKGFGISVIEADMPENEYLVGGQLKDPQAREALLAKMQKLQARITEIETDIAKQEKPDLLVCGTITGPKAAKSLGIPSLLTFLQPHGPKTIAMFTRRLTQSNKIAFAASIAAADLIILEGMPEIDGGVTFADLGLEAAVLKDKVHFTGPLLLNNPDELPEREFLKAKHGGAGDKMLVYATIGGGSQLIGEQFLQVVLEALRLLPQVLGVIATGIAISPGRLKAFNPPANAIIRGFVPGTELIKASDATIFHGGSSTLMTCLACGTPAVVVPSMGEQEDNGEVLAQNGAGLILAKESLSADILSEAVRRIINDADYRQQASRLKALCQKYGGAQAAAVLAEKLVAREVAAR